MDSGGGPGPPRPPDAPASQLPPSHDGNIGLFPFNPAVAQQSSQLGVQIAPNRGVMAPNAQASAPFPNIPFIPSIPQPTPSVSLPTNNTQPVNPQANMLHQINAVAAAQQSAAMQAGNLPQNVAHQQTRDFFGEFEKAFASKPGQPNPTAKGADVLDNALAMAMASQTTSRQQQTGAIPGQPQPQLHQAHLHQQRLQQLQLQQQLRQRLQQQQQQLQHPSAIQQSIISRQQQQMHPYLQQKQLAPRQLDARMLIPGMTLPGQPALTPGQRQEQTLSSRAQAGDSQLAQHSAKAVRKQQARRPRTKPHANLPIGTGAQIPNTLATSSLSSGLPRQGHPQQVQVPGQVAFAPQPNRYQHASAHLQRQHAGLPSVVPRQDSGAGLVAGGVQPSAASGSFPVSNASGIMSTPMLHQQASTSRAVHQSAVQGLDSRALLNRGRASQRVPQGNPDMAKFDAATLERVLRSTNDPKIEAAVKQQLEYLRYTAAFSGAQQRVQGSTKAGQIHSGVGTNAQRIQSRSQSGDISHDPSHAQVALLQRQQLLQKQQLFRQQQQLQQQQQQQLQQQQLQQQQLQQRQLQQQQLQQQQLQRQQLQQQQLQQQILQQQQQRQQQMQLQLQQKQLQRQRLEQQQLQLRSQGLPQIQRGGSRFPPQGLPDSQQQVGITAQGSQSTSALPTHLRNQIHAQQLQKSQVLAQHSQSSHSQGASQGTPSDIAGEGQASGSQNSQGQSSVRRPRRSPRVAKNGVEAINGIPGISSDLALQQAQNRVSGTAVLSGQAADLNALVHKSQATGSRLSDLEPSQSKRPGTQGSGQATPSRSPAEAVAQAAQAAQLAAVRAASANVRTVDDKRAAEDRKRSAREAELANIAEQKKRRLQTAPWNDYQRILAPDYATPFSGLVDAWQRLVPYHVVLTDEDTCVPKEEWDEDVDKLGKKYRDCFRSLKGSLNRLFDAGFDSIGSEAELPGYSSLCKDDSLILDGILLRDYYETARRQAIIARQKEMRRAAELARQRSLAERQAMRTQAVMQGTAQQSGTSNTLPAVQLPRTTVPTAIAASGALPPRSGPGLMLTSMRPSAGAPATASLLAGNSANRKGLSAIQQTATPQYGMGVGTLPHSTSNGLSAASLQAQARFGVHGYPGQLHGRQSAISTSIGLPQTSHAISGLNAQQSLNANFQHAQARQEMNKLRLPPAALQRYSQSAGMNTESGNVDKRQNLTRQMSNAIAFQGAPANGPQSSGLQHSPTAKAIGADSVKWHNSGRMPAAGTATAGVSSGTSTRMVVGGRSEIVRNGLQHSNAGVVRTGNASLPPVSMVGRSGAEMRQGMVRTSPAQTVGMQRAAGAGGNATSLNGSHHQGLNSGVGNYAIPSSNMRGGHDRNGLSKGSLGGVNNAVGGVSTGTRTGSDGVGLSGNATTASGVDKASSGVVGVDGTLGVLSSHARDQGQGSGKGGEFRGMGMGSLLNADGS